MQRKSWWGRNWKWVVPVGVTGCLVVFVGGALLLVSALFGLMKSSGAYQQALAAAKASPQVQQVLGTPIEEGWAVTGSVQLRNNTSGEANLLIPISGPKGAGMIVATGTKSGGAWGFSQLHVVADGGGRIDLLPRPPVVQAVGN